MIAEIMEELNNFFEISVECLDLTFYNSTLTISGEFTEEYIVGQYIRIKDSVLNDYVYKVTAVNTNTLTVEGDILSELAEEATIFGLAPPKSFLKVVTEIQNDTTSIIGVKSVKQGERAIEYMGDSSWIGRYQSKLAPYYKVGFE